MCHRVTKKTSRDPTYGKTTARFLTASVTVSSRINNDSAVGLVVGGRSGRGAGGGEAYSAFAALDGGSPLNPVSGQCSGFSLSSGGAKMEVTCGEGPLSSAQLVIRNPRQPPQPRHNTRLHTSTWRACRAYRRHEPTQEAALLLLGGRGVGGGGHSKSARARGGVADVGHARGVNASH